MYLPTTHDGEQGWIFDLVCPGNVKSAYHKRLLLLKGETVNWNLGFEDICKERHVRIAYNNHPQHFEISDQSGEMVKLRDIPSQAFPSVGFYGVSKQWEIQESFFKTYNVIPD